MRRRWPWLLAGLLFVTLSAGWLGWRQLRLDAEAALTAAALPAGAASAAPALADAWLKPSASPMAGASSVASAIPRSRDADPEDEVIEICGLGRVSKRQAQGWNPMEMARAQASMNALEQRKDVALSRLSARLAVGSDRERVAARLVMKDVEGAAAIAARSRDAAAYRLGLLGCVPPAVPTAPSCRGLTTEGWLQLDPEDAAPWLRLAADARQRRDEAAAAAALEQALKRRKRGGSRPLLEAVQRGLGGAEDSVGMGLGLVEIVGVEAAFSDWSVLSLGRYCGAEAVKDGPHRARCERTARWLFENADDLTDAHVALSLADRVGLPADQRPFTQEQLKRGREHFVEQSASMAGMDCRSLASVVDWPGRILARGELEAALQAAGAR